MPTREQERKALTQIKKILDTLGGNPENSYVLRAFDGCVKDAEENIENDFACSWKGRAESAEKRARDWQEKYEAEKKANSRSNVAVEETRTKISEDKAEAIEAAIKMYFDEIESSIRVCRVRDYANRKTVKFNINWGGIGGATAERAMEYAENLTKAVTFVNWINAQKWESTCEYTPYDTDEAYRRDVEKIAEALRNGTGLEQLI